MIGGERPIDGFIDDQMADARVVWPISLNEQQHDLRKPKTQRKTGPRRHAGMTRGGLGRTKPPLRDHQRYQQRHTIFTHVNHKAIKRCIAASQAVNPPRKNNIHQVTFKSIQCIALA